MSESEDTTPAGDNEELKTVAAFDHPSDADVFAAILNESGIRSMVHTSTMHMIGKAQVKVAEHDLEQARTMLREAELKHHAVPDDGLRLTFECEGCGRMISFAETDAGTVQTCPHCHEFVDVPEPNIES